MGINKEQLELTTEITKEYIISKVNPLSEKVSDISIAQKTVNENLSYCISGIVATQSYTPAVGAMIQFIPSFNNGIGYDENTKLYTLKAGISYSIKGFVRLYSYAGYLYYTIYDYTNSKELSLYGCMEGTTGQNQALFPTTCIVKPTTDIQIGVRIVQINAPSVSGMIQNTSYLTIEQIGKAITIDPVEYVNTTQGIEDAPVGHIMSFMGTTPPNHYLACDGTVYNITTYPVLSQFIKDQFGSFNFFGGDGTTTFAVPDLRNEFLRGYHGTKAEQLSGEIGVHQNGTRLPSGFLSATNARLYLPNSTTEPYVSDNYDSIYQALNNRTTVVNSSSIETEKYVGQNGLVTPRPTNTAVLYCIKYEPTYFMSIQGMIEESILFDGDIGNNLDSNVTNNIGLNDSIINYDEIRVYFYSLNGTGRHRDCKIISKDLLVYVIDTVTTTTFNVISCIFGYISNPAYTNINSRERGSTYTNLAVSQNQSHVTKVTGVKYKTFQS